MKVARRELPEYGPVNALADLRIYETLKVRIKEQSALADNYKKTLMAYVETAGEVDDKGHAWVELPDGRSLKREKRQGSPVLDEEFAIAWLENAGMHDCLGEITVVDDDKLAAAVFEKRIPKDVLDQMYPQPEPTFAFIPPKP